jgi:hypothetical protein
MEAQNGGAGTDAAPRFTEGQRVTVSEGVGTGPISSVEPGEDGIFYIVDIEEGTGSAKGPWRAFEDTLTLAPQPETPVDAAEGDEVPLVDEPASVFEELGEEYEQSTEDRREVFPILPGRFKGKLAVRVRPVDSSKRKKKVRRMVKRGGITDEAEAQYAATLIAEACETILVRFKDGEDYQEPHRVSAELGDEPVRFDQRLGVIVPSLGKTLQGNEPPATIVRLLFKNLDALDAFYTELDLWLKEALPSEGDDDEEGDEERPT